MLKGINIRMEILLVFIFIIFISGCSANIFEVFNPKDLKYITTVDELLNYAEDRMNEGDYTNAYKAYARVLGMKTNIGSVDMAPTNERIKNYNPTNIVAIEGICSAYFLMNINSIVKSITNLNISSFDPSIFLGKIGSFYNMAYFMQTNLYKIVNGSAGTNFKGKNYKIDPTINLNFYVYNTLYSIGFLLDMDNDNNIVNDTDDIITLDLSSSNYIKIADFNSLGFGRMLSLASSIPNKVNSLKNSLKRSEEAINNMMFLPAQLKAGISNVVGIIDNVMLQVDTQLAQFGLTGSNIGLSLNLLATVLNVDTGIATNLTVISTNLTNIFPSVGITNLDDLNNQLSNAGFNVTVSNSGQIIEVLTNIFTDMTNEQELQNMSNIFASYFGI